MAVFGSTINPALGRVDYSPLAQGLAMGGQLAAQGMTNFGQGVTQGIQSFLRNQEEKKNEQEGIAFIKSQMPGIDDATAKAGLKAAGGAAAFVKFKSDMAAQQDTDRMRRLQLSEMERQAAERARLEQFLTQSPAQGAIAGGARFEQLPTGAGAFAPREFKTAEDLISAAQKERIPLSSVLPVASNLATIAETSARARSLSVPKVPDLSFQEQAYNSALDALEVRKGSKATPQEKADLFQKISQLSRAQTNVQVGGGLTEKVFSDLRSSQNNIRSLKEVLSNYDDAINEITQEGAFSGPAGSLKFAGSRALQAFGIDTFKDKADAYQSAAASLANSVLAVARQLPGSASDKDVIFLERVATGGEKVPSADVLKKIKARIERKIQGLESNFKSDLETFADASKDDPNLQFAYKFLSGSMTPRSSSNQNLLPFPK